jgi:hypothetical protein
MTFLTHSVRPLTSFTRTTTTMLRAGRGARRPVPRWPTGPVVGFVQRPSLWLLADHRCDPSGREPAPSVQLAVLNAKQPPVRHRTLKEAASWALRRRASLGAMYSYSSPPPAPHRPLAGRPPARGTTLDGRPRVVAGAAGSGRRTRSAAGCYRRAEKGTHPAGCGECGDGVRVAARSQIVASTRGSLPDRR